MAAKLATPKWTIDPSVVPMHDFVEQVVKDVPRFGNDHGDKDDPGTPVSDRSTQRRTRVRVAINGLHLQS